MATTDRTTPRRPLSRERVIRSALRMIDERGLDELTMRALGAELGVEAMSIYKHVPNKDAILDGVVELLLEELETTITDADDWRVYLAEVARRVRALSVAHPSAFPLLLRRSLSAYRVGRDMAEGALRTIIADGFTPQRAAFAVRSVLRFTVGFSLSDPAVGAASEAAAATGGADGMGDQYPLVSALIRTVAAPGTEDELFEFGLQALIRGLEADANGAAD